MNADDLCTSNCGKMPHHYTDRQKRLEFLWRVYHSKQYDILPYPFTTESDGQGNYIPLRERRPSVRYNIPKIAVKKSVAMLFSGRNWPRVETADQDFTDWLDLFYEHFNFSSFATRVATLGCVGSVAAVFRATPVPSAPADVDVSSAAAADARYTISFEVWHARDCYPTFDISGQLSTLAYKYITTAEALRRMGLDPDPSAAASSRWWYRRILTSTEDITYIPTSEADSDDATLAAEGRLIPSHLTTLHNFGIVPAVWVRNLPSECEDDIDGACTFDSIIDFVIEIDYVLSQTGRGLRYNSDPQLAVSEPASRADGTGPALPPRTTSRILRLLKDGKADLLEMSGAGQKVAIEYVEKLRNFALEVLRGSRKDPQKSMSHGMSGKMAEILEDDLISLGTELRTSYSKEFLIPFTLKLIHAFKSLAVGGPVIASLTSETARTIRLVWGPWFEPTSTDQLQLQQALDVAQRSNRIDIDTARRITYHNFSTIPPKTVNWDENLTRIAAAERAINLYKVEIARIQAISSAATAAAKPAPSAGGESGEERSAARPTRSGAPAPNLDAALPDAEALNGDDPAASSNTPSVELPPDIFPSSSPTPAPTPEEPSADTLSSIYGL